MRKTGLAVLAAALLGGCASMGSGDGWVTLIDNGRGIENFNMVGVANWRIDGDTLVADKLAGKDLSYLVTKQSYTDFMIHAEFWVDDNANSGIFVRCANPAKIGADTCYEMNVFDKRPDPSYGTGAIVDVAKVSPMPRAGGKWNTFDITVKGSRLTLAMNGQVTADAQDAKLRSGPFALQYGAGIVKWRKVQIKPL